MNGFWDGQLPGMGWMASGMKTAAELSAQGPCLGSGAGGLRLQDQEQMRAGAGLCILKYRRESGWGCGD